VRGTVGPRRRLAACTAPWPFQKVTGRRPHRRRQTRRLKPGGVPVELPRGVLENAGVFGVFGEPWFFRGWEMSLSQSLLVWLQGAAAGKANGRLAGGGRRGRGDPTTRRPGRAIPSAVDSPVRQVRSVATQDVTTGQGVVGLKGGDHGRKLAAAKALHATVGSQGAALHGCGARCLLPGRAVCAALWRATANNAHRHLRQSSSAML
jgi:hypothetical protein